MTYRVVYHPAVLADDLPAIPHNLQMRIHRAISQRLTTEPTRYGAPLRQQLHGLWKLRVGSYRVVYRVVGREVWVYRIDHRKDVYATPRQRFRWHP